MKHWIIDIFNVWKRETKLCFRDEAVLIFFLLLPAMYPVLYSLIYNTEVARDIKVVVVDDCRSQLTRQFAHELDATPEVAVMDYVSNMQDAQRLIASHDAYGIVYFPRDFSSNIENGLQGHVSLYCDMGVLMRYKQMLSGLTAVQMDLCTKMQSSKTAPLTYQNSAIIESKQVPIINKSTGIASALLPLILVAVIQQSLILGICVLRAGSRERRLRNKGLDPMDVGAGVSASIIGKSLCHIFIYFIPVVYVLFFVPMFFDFPQLGDPLDILLLMLPFMLASSLLGQTLSVFVNDRESTFLVIAFTSLFFVFLSGISYPRYAMSSLWTALGNMVPLTWGGNGYVALMCGGAELSQVATNYKMLWVLSGVYFVSAYCVERFICRPRYRRMAIYASIDPYSPIKEECRRNAVDYRDW